MSRRGRFDTISPLGRAPARQTQPPRSATPVPIDPGRRAGVGAWLRRAVTEHLGLKFLSLILAATLLLLVNTDRDREITARVGVSYVLPEGRVLTSPRLAEVRVTVRGPWRRLRRFDEREIDRVNLDLTQVGGGEAPITEEMLRLPPGLELVSWSPRSVAVAFEEAAERTVPIEPIAVGRPADGYLVSGLTATPAEAVIRGAASQVAALASVATREVRVDGHQARFAVEAALSPPDGVTVLRPREVRVEVRVEPQLVVRRLEHVRVAIDAEDPTRWEVTPRTVDVSLSGTAKAVDRAIAAGVHPVVVVTGAGRRRELAVQVEGLPAGVGVEIVPARVRVGAAAAVP